MTVLYIRAHSRFAVCRDAFISGTDAAAEGRVVELSLDGCRVAVARPEAFRVGDEVTVSLDDWPAFAGEVRWLGDSAIGLKLVQSFHTHELGDLIALCRGESDPAQRLRA